MIPVALLGLHSSQVHSKTSWGASQQHKMAAAAIGAAAQATALLPQDVAA